MKLICGWCGKVLKTGDGPVSYGICPECNQKYPQPKRIPVIALLMKWAWRGVVILIGAAVLMKLLLAALRI